jgi:methionine sulfoxide reductase heme-binding subunit
VASGRSGAGVTSTPDAWGVSRGSGYVAIVLFTLSVTLGILTTQRLKSRWWPAFLSQELHRNISLLAVSFLGIHIITILSDKYVKLGSAIPFSSTFRPLWIGLGVIATYLVAAVIVTSLVRRWLPFSWWRNLHWLSYPLWVTALIHGAGSGTDTRTSWGVKLTAACGGVVALAVCVRIVAAADLPARRRLGLLAATIASTLLLTAWWINGPLRAGWSQ